MSDRKRPTGVTIMAILQLVISGLMLLSAAGFLVISLLVSNQQVRDAIGDDAPGWLVENATMIFGSLAVLFLLLAAVAFMIGYAFLKGRSWAWVAGIVFALISIMSAFVNPLLRGFSDPSWVLNLAVDLVVPWLIIIYLNQPSVKAFFNRQ
jgi:membrane protein YdbS with pleckstrin-like domain